MRDIGFSTGALALGDFRRGLALLNLHSCSAVELSALRESELARLADSLSEIDLSGYRYVSIHAPSRLGAMKESTVARLLSPCIERGWPVVMHPDAIQDHGCWRDFGRLLCLENMDKRKASGRTADELDRHFKELPHASLCFDVGHARQVDPTMAVARTILREYGSKLVQLHLSELDAGSRHVPLSMASVWAVQEIAKLVPPAPVILESVVPDARIAQEIEMARACFDVSGTRPRRVHFKHVASVHLP